jgi:hypothetical protein
MELKKPRSNLELGLFGIPSYLIVFGKNRAISGKIYTSVMRRRIGIMNIKAPLKMSTNSRSSETPFKTKQFIPTGGEIKAISTTRTMITPNHTKSNPANSSTGIRIGMVTTIIAKVSISAPRIMYMIMIKINIMVGERFLSKRKSASRYGRRVITNT